MKKEKEIKKTKRTGRAEKRLGLRRVDRKNRFSLTLLFSVVVFVILLTALLLAAGLVVLLIQLRVFGGTAEEIKLEFVMLTMALVSLVMGAGISLLLGKFSLTPINKLVNGMNNLAAGNFKTRIKYAGPLGNHPTFHEITESFNKMAEELENTAVLRSDFVNNFSHEFKTPIVSIAGFAKLLRRGDLTDSQREAYLDAIEEESLRLSYMATNVLHMTRIENQTILSEVTRVHLSEQLRACILLLEGKWSKKKLELLPDFDEFFVQGNEELLKQVWINLLDNAVKFSEEGATVAVEIVDTGDGIRVTVANQGREIPADRRERIFNKFYQVDESHAGEGNGIGLAIVKRVTELHGGRVWVTCEEGWTRFAVELPKTQNRVG